MAREKSILITGATAGIGRFAALYLAKKGYRVFAAGRSEAALESLRGEAKGLSLEAFRLDVTDAASIESARSLVDERTDGAGVDVLINNAGFGIAAPIELTEDADLRRLFETNVFGLMAVTRAFLPAMRRRGSGRVINVSSVGGRLTFPFFGAYNATKYAVESLSDALRIELRAFGIDVVLIEPGVIRSEFADRSVSELAKYKKMESPYLPVMARADELKRQTDAQAVGPECVARAMERAIEARRPAARYVAPFRARILLALFAVVPTRWLDAAMRSLTGLTRKHLSSSKSDPTVRPSQALAG